MADRTTSATAQCTAAPTPLLPAYVRLVVAVGAAVIVHSLFAAVRVPHPVAWLVFAALAVFAGTFTMKVASVSATVSVTDTFFIASAVLFGPEAVTLTVAATSFIVAWRRRYSWNRVAFNTADTSLSMWAASNLFFFMAGVRPLADSAAAINALIVPLLALVATYFLLNSGLTAVAVGLETRKSPIAVWRHHFLWLSLGYLAAGSVAFCLILLIQQVSLGATAMVLPLIIVFHLTLRSSFGRLEDAQRHLGEMDRLYLSTVETLAMAIDAKDDVTHSHVRRVQAYAVGMAKAMGVADEPTLRAIEAAALLHDTGKLAVPEHILNKPGSLTKAEFETMKRHVDVGADILSLVKFPYPVVPIVRCHHESWDGSGYPRGVKGTDIPLGARILSVVDCFDALTSDRPYRSALSDEAALDILRQRRGTMYDPEVVDTFINLYKTIPIEELDTPSVMHQISRARVVPQAPTAPAPASAATGASDGVLAFVSLARLATGEGTIGDVLALASNLIRDIVPGVTAVWYVLDVATNRLVVADTIGPAGDLLRGTSIVMGERLTGWVAANRQVIVNSDPALDLGPDHAELRSCMSVPLLSGNSLVGALTLYAGEPKAFGDDHGRLVQMLAPQVARAISRAQEQQSPGGVTHTHEKPRTGPQSLRLVATR